MTASHHPPVLLHALKLLHAGRHDEAARACQSRLDERPGDVDALQLLGVIAGMRGDFAEARSLLERANELHHHHPDILDNLAMACREAGDPAAAVGYSKDAIAAAPTRVSSWYGLALAQRRLADWQGAMASCHRVVELEPGHADAWASLAHIAERLNLMDEATDAAATALELDPDNAMAALAAAAVASRREDYAAVRERLENLLRLPGLSPNHEAIAHQRLGVALDRLGEPPAAFTQFSAANRLLSNQQQAALRLGEGPLALPAVRRLTEFVRGLEPGQWQRCEPDDGHPGPVFLLGFPRSGTTLAERIIDAHDDVTTLEERDTLVDLQRDFVLAPDGLGHLPRLDPATQRLYRQAYRRRVADWIEPRPGTTIVDKLPLHTASLPLINAVFPDARIVFVVRDPRDVCLSCFMQNFVLNEAMVHFLDLELTAEYYCEVMALGLASLERLPVDALTVRYETLVEDPESVCRSLLGYLGVDWDPAVLRWHALQRGRQIETPSYRAVAQPMYRSAIGRWRRYEEQLAPILERLAPYVERLGYA